MKKSVLIIEDNPLDAMLLERTMEINGYKGEISTVSNINDAILFTQDKINSKKKLPDLICLDMHFGDETGLVFLSFFNKLESRIRKKVKIIIITATKLLFEPEDLIINKRVSKVIDKPISFHQISAFL